MERGTESPLTTDVSDSDSARIRLRCVGDAPFFDDRKASPLGIAYLHSDGFQSSPRHVQAQESSRGDAPACPASRYCDAGKGGRLVCVPARSYASGRGIEVVQHRRSKLGESALSSSPCAIPCSQLLRSSTDGLRWCTS